MLVCDYDVWVNDCKETVACREYAAVYGIPCREPRGDRVAQLTIQSVRGFEIGVYLFFASVCKQCHTHRKCVCNNYFPVALLMGYTCKHGVFMQYDWLPRFPLGMQY